MWREKTFFPEVNGTSGGSVLAVPWPISHYRPFQPRTITADDNACVRRHLGFVDTLWRTETVFWMRARVNLLPLCFPTPFFTWVSTKQSVQWSVRKIRTMPRRVFFYRCIFAVIIKTAVDTISSIITTHYLKTIMENHFPQVILAVNFTRCPFLARFEW